MRSNLRAYRLVELLFSSSWDFIPFHSKLLEIFTDRRDIYRFIMRVTLEGRRLAIVQHIIACAFRHPWLMNPLKDNYVMIKDWQVYEMFDGAKRKTTLGPQTSECKVKNKQTNKQTKKEKGKLYHSTFRHRLVLFPFSWCYHGIHVPMLYFQT